MNRGPSSSFVLYVAVLPFYRESCMRILSTRMGTALRIYAGPHQLDLTVKTSIDHRLYTPTRLIVVARRLILQFGHLFAPLSAATAILDLNPRSISVWGVLILRRVFGRRTLLWGHLHPRAGGQSRTALLRRLMRRLSNGTILYGYDSVIPAKREVTASPVWVAPNSLYRAMDMGSSGDRPYIRVLYVGRLVPAKKVDVLLRSFAASGLASSGCVLTLVGEGSERVGLEVLSQELGVRGSVEFRGHMSNPDQLRRLYSDAICSVSPGYAGLSLTQSLGFGVPMIISRDEPHSPELELQRLGGVSFFDTDSVESLAVALNGLSRSNDRGARGVLSGSVILAYSAEAMADGIICALENRPQMIGDDGWPVAVNS